MVHNYFISIYKKLISIITFLFLSSYGVGGVEGVAGLLDLVGAAV